MRQESKHTITQVTALHGISAEGDGLLIGVQVNGQLWGWGECTGLFADPSVIYNMGNVTSTIHSIVTPALKERPFSSLRELCQRLAGLTETVTRLAPEKTPDTPHNMSRRALFAELLKGEMADSKTPMREQLWKRPLPPTLVFGFCQALLTMTALVSQPSPAHLLAAEYGLPAPSTRPKQHVEVTDENMAQVGTILKEHVTSLGYNVQTHNPKGMLGVKGEKLGSLVAQLKAWLATKAVHPHLTLHINLHGALTDLFDTQMGQILKLLNEIELAGTPYPVRIENAFAPDPDQNPAKIYRQLNSFLSYKKKPVKLIIGFPFYTLEAVQVFIEWGKIDGVHLDISHIGHLDQIMTIIAACQDKEIPVMVSGGPTIRGVETAVHIATATGANIIAGPPTPVYNETQRLNYQIKTAPVK